MNTNQNETNSVESLKQEFERLQAEMRDAKESGDTYRISKASEAFTMFVVRNPDMMKFSAENATKKVMKKKILTRVGIALSALTLVGIGIAVSRNQ